MSLQTTSNLTLSINASRPNFKSKVESLESIAIDTARWFQLVRVFRQESPELDTACWADIVSKDLRTMMAGGAVSQHELVADLTDAVSVLREFSSVIDSAK